MGLGFEQAQTVEVKGTSLAYVERGTGEPVVFVHGDLSDLRTWADQVEAIGASHRAIAYSRRYARPNEDIEAGQDNPMPPHVEDLAAFLEAVEAAPAHLVGSSWGGFVSLLAAIRHPELVRSLVLMEPPVLTLFTGPKPTPGDLLRLLVTRPRTAVAIARFGAGTIRRAEQAYARDDDDEAMLAFIAGAVGRERFDALPPERHDQARQNRSAQKAALLGSGFPPLAPDEVRAVAQSTLLITGAESPPFFQRLTDRLEGLLPDASRVEIAGASHIMYEEEPDATNRAILGFLAGLSAARR